MRLSPETTKPGPGLPFIVPRQRHSASGQRAWVPGPGVLIPGFSFVVRGQRVSVPRSGSSSRVLKPLSRDHERKSRDRAPWFRDRRRCSRSNEANPWTTRLCPRATRHCPSPTTQGPATLTQSSGIQEVVPVQRAVIHGQRAVGPRQ
jgi:hypothetical protein